MSGAPRMIIRRRRVVRQFQGGSWKIALADFMTALMALFLVLWLLSSTNQAQRENIAEYFRTPLLVAIAGGDRPTASISAIPGGGPDPAFAQGERARLDMRQQTRPADVQRRFLEMQRRIEALMLREPSLMELRDQLRVRLTPEGLLIQLLDSERRPMFERGSDKVAPYMSLLLRNLAPLLNELPNRVSISGHTDSLPYPGANRGFSNWELSTGRANASRRELMAGGFDDAKLVRVIGLADRFPMPGTRAGDPINRRIEVMVLDDDPLLEAIGRERGDESSQDNDTADTDVSALSQLTPESDSGEPVQVGQITDSREPSNGDQ